MFLGKYLIVAIMPYSKIYKDHLMEEKSVFKYLMAVNPKGNTSMGSKMRGNVTSATNAASMMATNTSKMADMGFDHALIPQ